MELAAARGRDPGLSRDSGCDPSSPHYGGIWMVSIEAIPIEIRANWERISAHSFVPLPPSTSTTPLSKSRHEHTTHQHLLYILWYHGASEKPSSSLSFHCFCFDCHLKRKKNQVTVRCLPFSMFWKKSTLCANCSCEEQEDTLKYLLGLKIKL